MVAWRKERDVLVDQLHYFFKVRLKDRKIRLASRLHPGFKRLGCHNRLLRDKRRWDTPGFVVVACRDSYESSFICIRAVQFMFQIVDETSDLIGNEFFLRDLAEGCQLLTSCFIAARRHVYLLVPTQYTGCATNVGDFTKSFFKLFKFLTHGISSFMR